MAEAQNSEDNVLGYDLWGEPVLRVRRQKGRPPFEWTEENSHKVSMLLAMGWNNDRIAGCILDPRTGKSISVPTLKRHFRSELSVRDKARDLLFSKQLMAAGRAALDGGNVGAMRFFDKLIEKNDAVLAAASFKSPAPEEGKKIEALGKKEAQRREAEEVAAGTGWGGDLKPGYTN